MSPPALPWLIVGGGPHGVHLAARLIGHARVPAEEVLILDPEPRLLGQWRRWTGAVGMAHLRSPSVHHLGLLPFELRQRPGQIAPGLKRPFARPYQRPHRTLFDKHSDQVIERFGLTARHCRGRALAVHPGPDAVRVETTLGPVRARRVVLALGQPAPAHPGWAPRTLPVDRVAHCLAPGFDRDAWIGRGPIAVVGGGLTGAQLALALEAEGTPVMHLRRHPWRVHLFDSDPGWIGPKHMAAFSREPDLAKRRAMIQAARHRGSLPAGILRRLQARQRTGDMTLVRDEVQGLELTERGVRLYLNQGPREVSGVLLATGFEAGPPGGALVADLVRQGLPTAPCGFPRIDKALRWHRRIHVTGGLAELELGPTARNLTGARRAAERILLTAGPQASAA